MLWEENDYRTFLSFPYYPNRTRDAAETISVLQRNFSETLMNNAGYWERLFNNNWMHDNTVMEAWAKMKHIGDQSLTRDKTSVAQVAFIHDDTVPYYMGGGSNNQCNLPGLAIGAIVVVLLLGWGAAARAWRNG